MKNIQDVDISLFQLPDFPPALPADEWKHFILENPHWNAIRVRFIRVIQSLREDLRGPITDKVGRVDPYARERYSAKLAALEEMLMEPYRLYERALAAEVTPPVEDEQIKETAERWAQEARDDMAIALSQIDRAIMKGAARHGNAR